jgi:hypothetical protein
MEAKADKGMEMTVVFNKINGMGIVASNQNIQMRSTVVVLQVMDLKAKAIQATSIMACMVSPDRSNMQRQSGKHRR